ncbi:MAG: cyclic pyranopterin monophosphate synthase MoaC [Aequoribacter sp.]|jgi:cyclic pyranopterin phosphate synthase|uniref:cyclic pyranopterin monophosphate synthase MoaC n=1 Tax=Aequoribacter sp. TaxID=2847771 RepID=UPI003C421E89
MSFTHIDEQGQAIMVDVSGKPETSREAQARARLHLPEAVVSALRDETIPKGDVLSTARIAGIQAVKKCSELIPLCHPLPVTKAAVTFDWDSDELVIFCSVKTRGVTGVEMEALTGASVAALTVYDMCKAIDKGITFDVSLVSKSGGKSGDWHA